MNSSVTASVDGVTTAAIDTVEDERVGTEAPQLLARHHPGQDRKIRISGSSNTMPKATDVDR